jgi:hypothetical protein
VSLINSFFSWNIWIFFSLLYAALPYIIFSNSVRIYAHFFISGMEYSSILLQNYAFHFFLIIGKNCEVKNCHIFQKEVCRMLSLTLIIDSVRKKYYQRWFCIYYAFQNEMRIIMLKKIKSDPKWPATYVENRFRQFITFIFKCIICFKAPKKMFPGCIEGP